MRKVIVFALLLVLGSHVQGMPFQWAPVESLSEDTRSVHSDFIDGSVFFVVTHGGAIFRTSDSCETWKLVPFAENRLVQDLWIDLAEQRSWYACARYNGEFELWYSSDNGDSWELRYISDSLIRYLSPSHLAPGLLLGAFQQVGNDKLILKKSENAGVDWYDVLEGNDPGTPPVWHFSSYWQAHWGRYISTDIGESWKEHGAKPVTGCGYDTPPSLFAATSNGLFRSRDNLKTWWPLLVENVNFVRVNPRNQSQLITGLKDTEGHSVLYLTQDNGKTFTSWSNGLLAPVSHLCIAADWLFLAVSGGRLYIYDERPADIDGSKRVDGGDLIIMATAFGSHTGDPQYVEKADLNRDGIIDGIDISILSAVFGHRFYYDDKKDTGDFPGEQP